MLMLLSHMHCTPTIMPAHILIYTQEYLVASYKPPADSVYEVMYSITCMWVKVNSYYYIFSLYVLWYVNIKFRKTPAGPP